ncbi:ATP-binding protein [Gemmata sp. JC673]|uniref:histidine kinase n=1 Tax=Gemmata algarum TaxID=2975278 RepID=A0ABU5EQK4_9BACT|nr:ATP-binding protein [Gemmata algarum]MDY3557628.1 ATP-binding protein [Gemmata algarum]
MIARLTAPVVAVSVLLIAVAAGAAWYAHNSQRNVSVMLDSHVASVHAAQELEISLREIHVQFDRYLITGQRKHLSPVPRLREHATEALRAAERMATTEPEQVLMRKVRTGYEHFFDAYDRLEQTPPEQGVYAKVLELIDTVLTREILEPAREYLRVNRDMLDHTARANHELSQRLTVGLVGLGVCGSVAGLLGGWAIAVSLRRSLLDTDRVLRDTAALLGEAVPAADGEVPRREQSETTVQRVTQAAAAVLNRLKKTERDALRAEQLAWVGQMAAGIAHEVRNPLTVIKLLVQAATDPRRANGFRPQDLRVLEGEILRLEQIIRTFLDFARPPRPDKRSVVPAELIRDCVAGVTARAELQGVTVRAVASADLPPLDADPGQLGQVLYNLLFNALDVLPSGGTVRVTAAVTPGDTGTGTPGGMLTVLVSDTGPGLPVGLEEQIFDPFISTKETGLGLGLSICRRIVEAHGGSIGATNGPAGGAVFVIRLPCRAQTNARPAPLSPAGAT